MWVKLILVRARSNSRDALPGRQLLVSQSVFLKTHSCCATGSATSIRSYSYSRCRTRSSAWICILCSQQLHSNFCSAISSTRNFFFFLTKKLEKGNLASLLLSFLFTPLFTSILLLFLITHHLSTFFFSLLFFPSLFTLQAPVVCVAKAMKHQKFSRC